MSGGAAVKSHAETLPPTSPSSSDSCMRQNQNARWWSSFGEMQLQYSMQISTVVRLWPTSPNEAELEDFLA